MAASVRAPRTLSYFPACRLLVIRQGKKEYAYFAHKLPCDFNNAVAVRLTKDLPTREEDAPDSYDVLVTPDTSAKQCECLGFLRHGHCKHADAVATLVARGHFAR